MMLELNGVLLEGEPQTLSLMARERRLTCLTGGTAGRRLRWLHAMMGFWPVKSGYISIDGEPLTPASAPVFRQLMAFAPSRLEQVGQVTVYEPPSVQDVFSLQANRDLPISNGILAEEVRRVAAGSSDQRAHLLAVASLLDKKILLVDDVLPAAMGYLRQKAAEGKIVVVTSDRPEVISACDEVAEL
jgi:ABC-type sugar transport system ATPase subunit